MDFESTIDVIDKHHTRFIVRSYSFQVLSWSCTAHNYQVSSTSRETSFLSPESVGGRYVVILETSSAVLNLSLVVVLGMSAGNLRLRDVTVDGERFSWRAALQRNQITDRVSIPYDAPRGYINVALRYLSPTRTRDASNSVNIVMGRYRVDIEFVESIVHPSKPEKTHAGVTAIKSKI